MTSRASWSRAWNIGADLQNRTSGAAAQNAAWEYQRQ
jgi:hypothetical protein